MANGFFKVKKGLNVEPKAGSTVTEKGDIGYNDTSGKVEVHNGTTADPVVQEAKSQALTNKTLDADLNTVSNIDNADIKAGAAIAHNKLADITAGSVLLGNASNVPTATALSGDITVNSSGVTDISAGAIVNADISALAAITRNKIAAGAANHVLYNDSPDGQLSSEAQLSPLRGGTGVDNTGGTLDFGNFDLVLGTSANTSLTLPTTGTLATLAGTETLSNKTVSDAMTFAEIASPSTPATGYVKVYAKADGNMYQKDDAGTETALGSGTGSIGEHTIWLEQGNGHGSTNTKIRRFSVVSKNVGTAITYNSGSEATNGAEFTINETGAYTISYSDINSGASSVYGITLNSAQLTTSIGGFANGNTVVAIGNFPTGYGANMAASVWLTAGDVIRPHTDGNPNNTGYFSNFRITKVGV